MKFFKRFCLLILCIISMSFFVACGQAGAQSQTSDSTTPGTTMPNGTPPNNNPSSDPTFTLIKELTLYENTSLTYQDADVDKDFVLRTCANSFYKQMVGCDSSESLASLLGIVFLNWKAEWGFSESIYPLYISEIDETKIDFFKTYVYNYIFDGLEFTENLPNVPAKIWIAEDDSEIVFLQQNAQDEYEPINLQGWDFNETDLEVSFSQSTSADIFGIKKTISFTYS